MKFREFFARIPRPVRAVINVVLVLFLAAAFYISIGCPTFSFTQEFRRAEKAHLIGKSEIVEHITDYYDYEKMLVAETEYGVCFFGRFEVIVGNGKGKNKNEKRYDFTYYEKKDDITIAIPPNQSGWNWDLIGYDLPIYIFHEYPEAVSAHMDVTIAGTHSYRENGQEFTKTYTRSFYASSERSGDGYFRLTLESGGGDQGLALALLSRLASGDKFLSDAELETVIPINVRLYDSQNNLIVEKTIEITGHL